MTDFLSSSCVVEVRLVGQGGHQGPQGEGCRGGQGLVAQLLAITWPTTTAATAENRVMPRAVRGLWPWATARVVITPAPRLATASWEVSSLPERGLGLGVTAASSRLMA